MRLADAYAERMGANLDASLDANGYFGFLRRKTTDEDRYEDRFEEWLVVRPISFMLKFSSDGAVVGESYNLYTEDSLPMRGYFRSTDDVQEEDVIELEYPITMNGGVIKNLEVVRLVHNYGTIVIYELGTYKGEFEEY
jgi:hypothetical protein